MATHGKQYWARAHEARRGVPWWAHDRPTMSKHKHNAIVTTVLPTYHRHCSESLHSCLSALMGNGVFDLELYLTWSITGCYGDIRPV